jgi:23S rRNA-/tRNA-specific pseudouridylate synthase
VVEVFAPRASAEIELLFEEHGVWAIKKPAALPTEPDKAGNDCVLSQLAARSGIEQRELFAVSRLDVGVSGVLLVTSSYHSQSAMLQERARGTLQRRYVALACGVPEPREGEWRDGLGRGSRGKRVVDPQGGQPAHSRYRVVATALPVARDRPATSLLALSPVTGRTHQLRAHSSAHAAPLLGDRRYSGPARMTAADGSVRPFSQVLLHAAFVEWGPRAKRQRVVCEPVPELVDTWLALEGDPAALQCALTD